MGFGKRLRVQRSADVRVLEGAARSDRGSLARDAHLRAGLVPVHRGARLRPSGPDRTARDSARADRAGAAGRDDGGDGQGRLLLPSRHVRRGRTGAHADLVRPLRRDAGRRQRRMGPDAVAAVGSREQPQPRLPRRRDDQHARRSRRQPRQPHGHVPGEPHSLHRDGGAALRVRQFGARLRHRGRHPARRGAALLRRAAHDASPRRGLAPALPGRRPGARARGDARRRAAQALRGRDRERVQDRVPRQYEPRAAHAAERHPRLLRDHRAGMLRPGRLAALQGICRRHPFLRRASAQPDQRPARRRQDRGRQDGDRAAAARGASAPSTSRSS